MICAWIETSSAETGSSPTISCGFSANARAMPTLCRCPPENSCGKAVVNSGRRPTRSNKLRHPLAPFAGAADPVDRQRLADDIAGRHARIERGVGILVDHLHLLPVGQHCPGVEIGDVDAADQDLPLGRLQQL